MPFRIFASVVGAALLVVYIAPVVVKLKSVALVVVAGIGVTMMLVDIWHSLKEKSD
jgi:hypothetical protein